MKNNAVRGISENELDELLTKAFTSLDFALPRNTRMLESVADYSLNRSTSFFVLSLTAKKMMVLFSVLAILGTSIILLLSGNNSPQEPYKKNVMVSGLNTDSTKPEIPVNEHLDLIAAKTFTGKPKNVYIKRERPVLTNNASEIQSEINQQMPNDSVSPFYTEVHNRAPENEYVFPVLTEKEIKENEKEKRRIIKIASRVSKDKRSDIARIPLSADGKIGNFYLGSGEVTNIEYRIFLFDLLINGKKEEFLEAKPNQSLWRNASGQTAFDTLESVYFSEKKYNYFPVVNITLKGAEMYCEWLQKGVDALRLRDDKIPQIEFRLPTEKEWLYAASSGSADAVYSWPFNTIQNPVNRFMANFCVQKLKEQFSGPIYYPKYKINLDNYTSAGLVLNDSTIATIDVWSYNPNTFGLYGACGNASEMVYTNDSRKVNAKGGNWASDFEHLKIFSKDEFEEVQASPMIGFRVCAFVK